MKEPVEFFDECSPIADPSLLRIEPVYSPELYPTAQVFVRYGPPNESSGVYLTREQCAALGTLLLEKAMQ